MAFYDVIRCDGVNGINWLIYKHPVDEFNNKSRLIVSPGQVAIIVHNGKIEKIVQEGTHKIDSELLPFLKGFTKAFFGGNNPYPIEIYFINKRLKLDLLWGTSDPIKLIDPKYNIQINVRARGQIGVRLDNYQYFYQTLVGTLMKGNYIDFDIIQTFFRGKLNQIVKKQLSSFIIKNRITYFEIDPRIDEIQVEIQEDLKDDLAEFGFELINLSIESINVPDDDLNKLNDILHKKAEYEQLGDAVYRTTRGYDVLEAGASNNNAAATMMGVGMGMNMGSTMGSASPIIPPVQGQNAVLGAGAASAGLTCPKCGKPIAANAKFCPECGAKIIHECPNCHQKVEPGTKFCPNCGNKLGE
ncbi:MAG: SPFH domain-containing protein [Bacilli bacterium]|nr:SPFH domain-containing protein [Bacilli bacterium]